MINNLKVAISIPKENFEKIERARKRLGLQRSAAVDQAIQFWLKNLEEQELIKKYQQGYLKHPESLEEIDAWAKTSANAFKEEGWR